MINIVKENAFIVEVAGKDSIAAVLKALKQFKFKNLLSVSLWHRAIYGNIYEPLHYFKYLIENFPFEGIIHGDLIYLDAANLFEQTIVKTLTIIQKYFKYYHPCPACHLFFHMIRIPIAKHYNINQFITGEREYHGTIQKLNQLSEILSTFKNLLHKYQIELIQPLKKIQDDKKIYELLENLNTIRITPSKCIFSKSYYDEMKGIPLNLKLIISSLKEFYYPLLSKIVDFIIDENREPDEIWINEQINAVVTNLKLT
ncbi:MAG: hypothetical protein ACFFAO_10305 [Candidatus Hermodarchaeota archaeon]